MVENSKFFSILKARLLTELLLLFLLTDPEIPKEC